MLGFSVIPRNPLCTLVALLVVLVPVCAHAQQKVRVEWKLNSGDLAEWSVEDVPREDKPSDVRRIFDPKLHLYGYQIDERGEAHFPVHSVAEIPYDLALRVPIGKFRPSASPKMRLRYDRIDGHHALALEISGNIVELTSESLIFEGRYKGVPARAADPPPKEPIWSTTCSGTLRIEFDVLRGIVSRADVEFDAESHHEDEGTDPEAPKATAVATRTRFAFKATREYNPDWAQEAWKLARPVHAALDSGTAWLEGEILPDGSYGTYREKYSHGQTCLAALTLLVCGADRDSPETLALVEKIRSYDPKKTYEIALALMALEAWYAPADEVAAVHARKRQAPHRREVSARDAEWVQRLADRLVELAMRQPDGWGWSYSAEDRHVDLSNTQYAALGLLSAWRAGARIPEESWTGLARGVLRHQSGDKKVRLTLRSVPRDARKTVSRKGRGGRTVTARARGFSYRPGAVEPKGSMTCGGISTLRIVRDVLLFEGSRNSLGMIKDLDRGIEEGWAWMADQWAVNRHPPSFERHWLYYYLYSLERAGVLCGIDRVNQHDWYFEGAGFLVSAQKADGSWGDRGGEIHQTCFALLFLKRGTVPLPRPEKTGAGR